MRDLSRLFNPGSIALFGGNWVANVIAQLQKSGYAGDIWPVNPKRDEIGGIPCLKSIDDLPHAPDAAFVGVNREMTIEVIGDLAKMGAGGATCFASGFLESEAETAGGADLQRRLVEAAGDMPFLGPNCYGILNYLDNVTLWPDQHGGLPVTSGVGIIAQSSNIAVNITMQKRALPLAMMVAAGNQAQTGIANIATAMLADPRISAIGLYLEGFGDIRELEKFSNAARKAKKPVVALKIGKSAKARLATMTHTASLAGNAAASSALLKRFGFIETHSIGVFLETLKLADCFGRLDGNGVASISCSGGEASLMADLSEGTGLEYRDFTLATQKNLKDILGPIVTIANPLDYHTFIWGNTAKMTDVFAGVMADNFALSIFVLDVPRSDRCDISSYRCAIDAIIAAKAKTGARVAVLASLPENLDETISAEFKANGVVCLHGMEEGIAAISAMIADGKNQREVALNQQEVLLAVSAPTQPLILNEASAKAALAKYGLPVPRSVSVDQPGDLAAAIAGLQFPLCLKALGIAHKSEEGAVILNLKTLEDVIAEAEALAPKAKGFLVEEMVDSVLAELIVGITRDPTGLLLLTLGAGGVLTELMQDTAHAVLPVSEHEIRAMLSRLKISRLLAGYRGKEAADISALTAAIAAICRYGMDHAQRLVELDVNPLMVTANNAIAVDALISLAQTKS